MINSFLIAVTAGRTVLIFDIWRALILITVTSECAGNGAEIFLLVRLEWRAIFLRLCICYTKSSVAQGILLVERKCMTKMGSGEDMIKHVASSLPAKRIISTSWHLPFRIFVGMNGTMSCNQKPEINRTLDWEIKTPYCVKLLPLAKLPWPADSILPHTRLNHQVFWFPSL